MIVVFPHWRNVTHLNTRGQHKQRQSRVWAGQEAAKPAFSIPSAGGKPAQLPLRNQEPDGVCHLQPQHERSCCVLVCASPAAACSLMKSFTVLNSPETVILTVAPPPRTLLRLFLHITFIYKWMFTHHFIYSSVYICSLFGARLCDDSWFQRKKCHFHYLTSCKNDGWSEKAAVSVVTAESLLRRWMCGSSSRFILAAISQKNTAEGQIWSTKPHDWRQLKYLFPSNFFTPPAPLLHLLPARWSNWFLSRGWESISLAPRPSSFPASSDPCSWWAFTPSELALTCLRLGWPTRPWRWWEGDSCWCCCLEMEEI